MVGYFTEIDFDLVVVSPALSIAMTEMVVFPARPVVVILAL